MNSRPILTIALILVALGVVGWLVFLPQPQQASLAKVHLDVLAHAVGMYHLDHHALPRSIEDLLQQDARTSAPYLERIPGDPWRHAYTYRILNEERRQFELRSGGVDGIVGTDDDLVKTTQMAPTAAGVTSQELLSWIDIADVKALRVHLETAKRAHRAVAIVVWAVWSTSSRKYDRLLDGDEQLKRAFGQLLCLRIDVSADPAEALRKELGVPLQMQPYMVFFSTEGRAVRQLDVDGYLGERSKDELLSRIRELHNTR